MMMFIMGDGVADDDGDDDGGLSNDDANQKRIWSHQPFFRNSHVQCVEAASAIFAYCGAG